MYLIKKPKSPYWYAKFASPRNSGRYVSKSTGIKAEKRNRVAALAVAKDIQDRLEREAEREAGGAATLLADVVDQYWVSEAQHLKSADNYLIYLGRIVDFLGEARAYCDVGTPDVAAFVDELESYGLAPGTVNRYLSIWQRMHKVAGTKRGLPVQMIDWSICRRTEPEGRNRFLEMDEVLRVADELPQRGREIFLFGLMTGCRKEQILSLSWEQVDMAQGRCWVIKKHRKANKRHFVELNEPAMQVLRDRQVACAFRDGLVFDTTNFRRDWAGAIKRSGVEDFRFHDTRHTAATWLARRAPLQVVKEFLGHGDISMTMRYAHVQQDDVRRAVLSLPSVTIEEKD